jgi:hypothetical protein
MPENNDVVINTEELQIFVILSVRVIKALHQQQRKQVVSAV